MREILSKFNSRNYKFAYLTCILWPHYLKKYKKVIFNNVIHVLLNVQVISYY